MNLNKGCIEIMQENPHLLTNSTMNLNKGCIEMIKTEERKKSNAKMNLNKGCIEIISTFTFIAAVFRWTLTRVVLKLYMDALSENAIQDEP